MKIGFIILVWNSEKVIAKCLQSILNLHFISPSIVVIDNGSSDNTSKIIEGFLNNYSEKIILLQYSENMGTTVSRNAGIQELRKKDLDFFCILDSDTVINDDAFLIMMDELKKHPQYGLIGPKMVTSSGIEQMSARCFPTMMEKIYKAVPVKSVQKIGENMEIQVPPSADTVSYPVDYLMSACWLIKPEVINTVGLLDEKIFYAPEDAEYCIRVWKAGYQVAFCPKAQIIHEWQRLSKKKIFSKMNWEHIKGLAYMFRKHRYLLTSKNLKKNFE